MLAVSPLRNTTAEDENKEKMEMFTISSEDFPDFADGNLLESINFEDLFVDGDGLPDLELGPEIFSELPAEELQTNTSVEKTDEGYNNQRKEEEVKVSGLSSRSSSSKGENPRAVKTTSKDADKGRKLPAQAKNQNLGKIKLKVDWTPELHRRFVQAVEQLGLDKAVPSRILEIMGIECLTRHNIASHLQKYRSHRKHLLAREAEAANWSHRRQIYGGAAATPTGGVKRDMNPWLAPIIGCPPMSPSSSPMNHQFRPLHVWGHPTMDRSLMHLWPKHLARTPSPPPPRRPTWPPPPADPSYWHHHHHQNLRVRNGVAPGTPCFPQPQATTRFAASPVPGIPPHLATVYKADPGIGVLSGPHPLMDFHPSRESIDAAIGDVLSKPGLPLPLGLKPPSCDGVLGELQRQGVPNIPPSSST
ncbi:transcription activator GLK1-like isoform X2 [Hibiscus syriacus]|uniref:Transcription activator GLK1-like isoform X2 n=1 Tax=Hibiscus syriacus TaxID=106335 RepID=A0A6A3D416_HIBSY|nr:transcription activator GLK1-like [Hibiscus syriacus]KAE8736380.1 transcription activator GLK1-like isoform X2 [Hibiscus syriacus]